MCSSSLVLMDFYNVVTTELSKYCNVMFGVLLSNGDNLLEMSRLFLSFLFKEYYAKPWEDLSCGGCSDAGYLTTVTLVRITIAMILKMHMRWLPTAFKVFHSVIVYLSIFLIMYFKNLS